MVIVVFVGGSLAAGCFDFVLFWFVLTSPSLPSQRAKQDFFGPAVFYHC